MRYRVHIYIALIAGALAAVFVFINREQASVVQDPEGFKRDQEAQVSKNNQEILNKDENISSEGGSRETYPHPISIAWLKQHAYDGRDFTVGKIIEQTSSYKKYFVTYKSGELTISGTMSVPTASPPAGGFPVAFTNHGFIEPSVYTNGRGLRREGAYLAGQGFVVVHSDYRNHAQSSKDDTNDANIRIGYIIDVVNAVRAVQSSDLDYINKNQIFMLGHSMGGGIAQGVMVAQPDLVKAFVLYAPVSMNAADSFNRWTTQRPELAAQIRDQYGSPEQNPEFWKNISPITFVSDIQSPVMIFHGTADSDVPIEWSRTTRDALAAAGKQVELIEYSGQPHEFTMVHTDFMRQTVEFFKSNIN